MTLFGKTVRCRYFSYRTFPPVLLLNPGSPVVPRLADRTVMLLEINNKEVDVEVIKIGNPVCSTLDLDKFKGE